MTRRGRDTIGSRPLVRHAKVARWVLFGCAVATLVGATTVGSVALDDVRSGRELVAWLEDQYAFFLFFLVVMQASVAASASGLPPRVRTAFRWVGAGLCALLALFFPLAGGWADFGVGYGTFVAGVLVVALADATVGDAGIDHTRHDEDPAPTAGAWFLAPPENLVAVHLQVGRALGAPPGVHRAVEFARAARREGRGEMAVGRARLEAQAVSEWIHRIRICGPLTAEQRRRLELVAGILGEPGTEASEDRIRVWPSR